jgi:curli production assembly/transport component CsgG
MDHAFDTKDAHPGLESTAHESLTDLPQPENKVVTAVYQFRDQTGQYKPKQQGSSFSRAVTQGGTAILLKALKDSDWFRPIERKGLSNLTQERDIIRSIRSQYQQQNPQQLSPLLYAGILLEGGIIGYDSNVITGGGGLRIGGVGGSGTFRRDQVTVYLRAVSTQTGEILKTVHTTKTVISQELEGGVFRFIAPNLQLEAEAGMTFNEPTTMAVTEAIDASVRSLVLEGIRDGLFTPQDSGQARQVITEYEQTRGRADRRDYFDRLLQKDNRPGLGISARGMVTRYQGDYRNPQPHPTGSLGLSLPLTDHWAIGGEGSYGELGTEQTFDTSVLSTTLQATYRFVPGARFTPFLRADAGVISRLPHNYTLGENAFLQGGARIGAEYMVRRRLGLSVSLGATYAADDGLDGATVGRYHDSIWKASIGLTYYTSLF